MSLTVSRPELLDGDSDALFRQVVHDSLGFAVRLQEIRKQDLARMDRRQFTGCHRSPQ